MRHNPPPPPPPPEPQVHRSANSELQQAARDFNAFWNDEARIKDLIRKTLTKGGDGLF